MPDEEPSRPKRERSARYPGLPLADCVDLCKFIDGHGLDGLTAADIASALGYRNVKTNTFSARLSAARQFGLLVLKGDGYALTPLARAILHPVDSSDPARLYRKALLEPPLYAELAERLADKRVPEAPILANVLYHHHQITASAKLAAAEAFLESARYAGVLGGDEVFRLQTTDADGSRGPEPGLAAHPGRVPARSARPQGDSVRLELRLWDHDRGKVIRVRAPESITPASFERFVQAFRLLVRIEDAPEPESPGGA